MVAAAVALEPLKSTFHAISPVAAIFPVAAKAVAVEAFPVKAPTKAVDVILVAPVTTPASTLIVPSKTIADPAAGVILIAPVVAVIVLPLTLRLSTCNVVKVPSEVIADWAAPVTVAAVPEAFPVTLPVNGPVKPVAVYIPVPAL